MKILLFQRHNFWILLLGILMGICVSLFTKYLVLKDNYLYEDDILVVWQAPCRMKENTNPTVVHKDSDSSDVVISDILSKYKHSLDADENELSNALFENIRIFCFIVTQPPNHESKAKHMIDTWGKRCNVLYFVSTQNVDDYPTVIYNGTEGREILWGKTKVGFKYAYEKHFYDADWFVKADDDTFMILENLRYMLLDKDPADPVYYGCRWNGFIYQGYMSGGAGYVLSKEALRRFVEEGLPDGRKWVQSDAGAEDLEMGKCLQNVGVKAGDSRDQEGKLRFFPFRPIDHLPPDELDPDNWYWSKIWYTHEQGIEGCSDSVISFHYVEEQHYPYLMEYLIYNVYPFGIHRQLTGSAVKDKMIKYLIKRPPANISKKRIPVNELHVGHSDFRNV